MKTEKLYYKDAYIKEFDARVLSVTEREGKYDTVLDRTAFFPEEGGQHADTGRIDGISVLAVSECDGIIHHILEKPVAEGSICHGEIDFDVRFDKMQLHSAEHLVSGIIHSLYGGENVGFHLGPDEVTFDTDIPLTREMLDRVEELANRAIYENREIIQHFPSSEELPALTYRAKLELTEDVRIVEIEGYDSCACCAPHVRRTGEIGIIKFSYFEKHKGGMRVYLLAGKRAYDFLSHIFREADKIGTLLSAPTASVASEVEKLHSAKCALEYKLSAKTLALASAYADSFTPEGRSSVVFLPELDMAALREYTNLVFDRLSGILVALIGEAGDYKYVIRAKSRDVTDFIKEANAALGGKGGGRGSMAQGSFTASLEEIKSYFERL